MELKFYDYSAGELLCRYIHDLDTGHISLMLLPEGEEGLYTKRREFLELKELTSAGLECPAWEAGSLCHLSLLHHGQGTGAGETLKHGISTQLLQFVSQEKHDTDKGFTVETLVRAEEGYSVIHRLNWERGDQGVTVQTEFENHTGHSVTLELITSFSLDTLTPFDTQDAPDRLVLHRFHGGWSLEGKEEHQTLEELNLERTWYNCFPESERYGSIGSYPVKRWFPFGAVEDKNAGVIWAAQLACPSSWQMELSRNTDCYSFSGGLADREFGSWKKILEEDESFTTPMAYLTVGRAPLSDVCQNITGMFHKIADTHPECEADLPVMFNDWCAYWGNPSEEHTLKIADCLAKQGISYLIVDAGWAQTTNPHLGQGGIGEWKLDTEKFPHGLKWLSRRLKERGMRLGIWFEFEATTKGAAVFEKEYDALHLKRDGIVIKNNQERSFWDFRNPWVTRYLKERVLDFLRDNEIGYLKVDYNGNIGLGCDGCESLGEGLRQQIQCVQEFFASLRRELPDLVIENCASGGHRLEPSMMALTALSSFSDAHERPEIPYIAANLHNLILPRQSQIWAVVRPEQYKEELEYRLSSGLLGRFCLSGKIDELGKDQRQIVNDAVAFYQQCGEIIKYGRTKIYRNCNQNMHHLNGVQAVLRVGSSGRAMLVVHSFQVENKVNVVVPLPWKHYEIMAQFGDASLAVFEADCVRVTGEHSYQSAAFLLKIF